MSVITSLVTHHADDHTNYWSFVKFWDNLWSRRRANSVSLLAILRPAKNWALVILDVSVIENF